MGGHDRPQARKISPVGGRKRAALVTLGCKVNWYDSRAMEEALRAAGFDIAPEGGEADVYIVNTCAVTAEAERKSRQTLRKLSRLHPGAAVVATGCYAQRDPQAVGALSGVSAVHGTAERAGIVAVAHSALEGHSDFTALSNPGLAYEDMAAATQQGHTRAVVKIEDGCDAFCAYCVIPHVRGLPRSRPLESIAAEARTLAKRGFAEIVLVGINLARYGSDLPEGTLAEAVAAASAPGIRRVRLGSLEPDAIDGVLLASLAAIPAFCPHFHLSLQSGCDATLARMGRRYTAAEYARKLALIREAFPDASVTTDIIVGFPGETEEEFAQSAAFAAEQRFLKVHVFPYSRRSGTPAADMPGQVPKAIKEARATAMQAAAAPGSEAFRKARLGQVAEVLFEECEPEGLSRGYTANYIEVLAPVADAAGNILPVRLTALDGEGMTGLPV